MGSDRARITYDQSRQYRAVVMQQGRVTVEADWNEEEQIVNEEERKEALDFVGPDGTPDNGYRVTESGQVPKPPFDFSVDKGTMYVGGVRAFSADPIQYSQQLDWLDYLHDPDWVDPSTLANVPLKNEFIYLYLREQEVSAIEDSALREVALGGPDTAARLRLIQHIVRRGVDATDCASALKQTEIYWQTEGLQFDDQTMRLSSKGTLQVSFSDVVTTPDPCEPQARGGYLGADNQLIRVQISGYDKDARTYRLVWGFDNASFLYRVTVADDLQTLRLQSRPVDDFHKPRANQAVEVLRSAVQLSKTTNDYVAPATGIVATLEKPYASDTQSITLPPLPELIPLGGEYNDPGQTPVVFLRVWEEENAFTPGTAVVLGSTGLQVTLQTPDNGPFHVGDYWLFAARPDTAADPNASTEVFPHRYLEAPQPPEGPRLWACPLAVITWTDGALTILEDCRNLFDNLVELTKRNLGGCCTVTVRPEDITANKSLQSILDKYSNQERVTICLMPGTYALPEPLRLGQQHSNLTIEGCHNGVIIQAAEGSESNFRDGLIVLDSADNVTLQGFRCVLPLSPFMSSNPSISYRIAGLQTAELRNIVGAQLQNLQVAIGIRPLQCNALTIKDCFFQFPPPGDQSVFGAGIFAGSACSGLTVQGNQFVRSGDAPSTRESPFSFLFGYLLAPTTSFNAGRSTAATATTIASRGGTVLLSRLQDATFQDNLFTGLAAAALIYADTGAVRFERNIVRNCYAGFWLLSLSSLTHTSLLDSVSVSSSQLDAAQQLARWVLEPLNDPLIQIGASIARGYPLPEDFDTSQAIQVGAINTRTAVDSTPIQTFFDKALQVTATEAASGTTVNKQVKLNTARMQLTNSLFASQSGLGRFSSMQSLLATAERAVLAASQLSVLQLALHMLDNEIDTVLPNSEQSTAALVVWDYARTSGSTMTMSANKLRNQSFMPTAIMLVQEGRCAITGNLILNEIPQDALSLILSFGTGVAITGNVLQGTPLLPNPRYPSSSVPSPMNTWQFLNTMI